MSREMFVVFSCVLLQVLKGPLVLGIPDSECCYTKEVGGVRYVLEDTEDTSPHNCNSNCVYKEESDPDSIYCFQDGDLPVSCVNQKAPIKTEVPIEEGNESIVQENYFQEETGILTVKVPPHKNYTESVFFLHQDSKTSMLKTGGMCHVTELPDYVNVSAMAQGFKSHNRMKVREANTVTTYLIKSGEARYGVQKRAAILHPEADHLCNDAPVVKTNDVHVTKEEFEKFERGEIITVGNVKSSRQNDNCHWELHQTMTRKGRGACGYGWRNPAGGGLSMHQVSGEGLNITCAIPDYISNNLYVSCEQPNYDFKLRYCQCKMINSKNRFSTCLNISNKTEIKIMTAASGRKLEEGSFKGNIRTTLTQSLIYHPTDDEGHAVEIIGPGYEDYQTIDVVMHAHTSGYWHYGGYLKNNKLMKVGDTCYVATLPYEDFPLDIVTGIREIKEGNDFTTEEDEELKQQILIPTGIFTPPEQAHLHSIIREKCKDSSIEKFVVAKGNQEETLKSGGVIVLKDDDDFGYAAMVSREGSGSWRYPNSGGSSKLWINQIVSPVKTVLCCFTEEFADFLCECEKIDNTNFESCHSKTRKAKQMKKIKEFIQKY